MFWTVLSGALGYFVAVILFVAFIAAAIFAFALIMASYDKWKRKKQMAKKEAQKEKKT